MTGMHAPGAEERSRSGLYVGLGFFTIGVVAGAQAVLDPALPIDLLYVLPVAAIAMTGGRPAGLVAAGLSAVMRSLIVALVGAGPAHPMLVVLAFALGALVFGVSAWFAAEITSAAARARAYALTDPLTGLGNRRFFEDVAEHELNRSRRYQRPLALVYIDVDRFKQVNDERGHGAGDALLRMIADEIPSGLRRSDIVARVGGDEFAILLPETPASGAAVAMGKLRDRLNELVRGAGFEVGFSVGIATCEDGTTTLKALMSAADATMYAAKRTGRGLVVGDARLPTEAAAQQG